MKSYLKILIIFCLVVFLFLPVFADEQKLEGPVNLKFGAMRIGTSWYIYAATYSNILEKTLPEGSTVEVVPQGGGIANPLAVSQGQCDLALSNVATAKWAYDGIQMYEGRPAKNIRALAGGLNKVYVYLIFREDFIKKAGLDSFEKISEAEYPIHLICKPEGSTAPPVARMILSEYGMDFDIIKKWGGSVTQISGGQIPAVMRDKRADIWVEVAPGGHPAITEGMMTANLRMVEVPEKVRESLAKYGLFEEVVPANLFKNQPYSFKTVSPGTVIIASSDMPDELAYVITKIICEHKEEVVAVHASIKPFEPEKAWMEDRIGIPLHPGAEKYYKDKGWMK